MLTLACCEFVRDDFRSGKSLRVSNSLMFGDWTAGQVLSSHSITDSTPDSEFRFDDFSDAEASMIAASFLRSPLVTADSLRRNDVRKALLEILDPLL